MRHGEHEQTLNNDFLKNIGVGDPSRPLANDSILDANLFYAKVVFIPLLAASFGLVLNGFIRADLGEALFPAFLAELLSAAALHFNAVEGKKRGTLTRAKADTLICLHICVCAVFFLICAAETGRAGELWFTLLLIWIWLLGLMTVRPWVAALLLLFIFFISRALCPAMLESENGAARMLVFSLSIIYLTGMRYYRRVGRADQDIKRGTELRRMEYISYTDELTGVINRRGGDELIRSYIAGRPDGRALLALFDVNNFKLFNDLYGHAVGDELLKSLTQAMREHFSGSGDIIRNGGDEFVVFIRDAFDREAAEEKLRSFAGMSHTFELAGKTYHYDVSIGYSLYPDQSGEVSDLFVKADCALYHVKMRGGSLAFYDDSMYRESRTHLGFNLKDVAKGIPGAILVYKAYGDQQILFANEELVNIFECGDMNDLLTHIGNSFRTLVHPDDIERVEKSIWEQIKSGDGDNLDYVNYRIITKNGKVKNITDFGKLVHNPHYGDIFYVFLYDTDNKKKALRHELAERKKENPKQGS